jgi:hypothetical protein
VEQHTTNHDIDKCGVKECNIDSKTKKTSPIHELNKKNLTQDTTDTGSCIVREFGAVCDPSKTKK